MLLSLLMRKFWIFFFMYMYTKDFLFGAIPSLNKSFSSTPQQENDTFICIGWTCSHITTSNIKINPTQMSLSSGVLSIYHWEFDTH